MMKYLWVTSGQVICLSPKETLWYNYADDPASGSWPHTGSETGFDQHKKKWIYLSELIQVHQVRKASFYPVWQFNSSGRGKKLTTTTMITKTDKGPGISVFSATYIAAVYMVHQIVIRRWLYTCYLNGSIFDISHINKALIHDIVSSKRCFCGHHHWFIWLKLNHPKLTLTHHWIEDTSQF